MAKRRKAHTRHRERKGKDPVPQAADKGRVVILAEGRAEETPESEALYFFLDLS